GVSRDAAAKHLENAEARAPFDEIGLHVAGFGGENIFLQPVVEVGVAAESAKEAHGGVRVDIDEAGHDDFAGGVNGARGGETRCNFVLGADGDDGVTANGDSAGIVDVARGVHGDDDGVGDENVGAAAGLNWRLR